MLPSFAQAAIRETMVLPNCESAYIPWMLAEKDDWVPRKFAPFMWLNQDAAMDNNIARAAQGPQPTEAQENNRKTSSSPAAIESEASLSFAASSSTKNKSSEDLRAPLLATDEPHETYQQNGATPDSQSSSWSLSEFERQSDVGDENDSRPKKMGRKARMMDLTKKMGEKFEEKKRHIEERGRHIVEKMRGP